MNKKVLEIMIIIVSAIVMIFCGLCIKSLLITRVPLVENKLNRFIIPITIKGNTYNFFVDTGAKASSISDKTANALGLSKTEVKIKLKHLDLNMKQLTTLCLSEKVICKIGTFPFKTDFAMGRSIEHPDFDGILGSDIINRYRWLFDFEKNKVTLSKSEWLPLFAKRDKDHCWSINFDLLPPQPFLNFTMNDTIPAKFMLDTGWETFLVEDDLLLPEISFMIADSTDMAFDGFSKSAFVSMSASSGGSQTALLAVRGLRINDSPPMDILASLYIDEYYRDFFEEGVSGVVGRSLMMRHRQVLYDPLHGKITFYKSPDDKTSYSDENLNAILQHKEPNGQQPH